MSVGSFPQSVAELRAELERLRLELKRLDAAGDRRGALKVLGAMIATQKAFMARWPVRTDVPNGGRPDDR